MQNCAGWVWNKQNNSHIPTARSNPLKLFNLHQVSHSCFYLKYPGFYRDSLFSFICHHKYRHVPPMFVGIIYTKVSQSFHFHHVYFCLLIFCIICFKCIYSFYNLVLHCCVAAPWASCWCIISLNYYYYHYYYYFELSSPRYRAYHYIIWALPAQCIDTHWGHWGEPNTNQLFDRPHLTDPNFGNLKKVFVFLFVY